MKYGKLLAKATRLSNPAWRKYWMDYGELKRLIGLIAEETGGPEARTSAEQPGATKEPESPSGTPKKAFSANKKVTPTRIASLPSERQFFVELKKNLELVCKFYDAIFGLFHQVSHVSHYKLSDFGGSGCVHLIRHVEKDSCMLELRRK